MPQAEYPKKITQTLVIEYEVLDSASEDYLLAKPEDLVNGFGVDFRTWLSDYNIGVASLNGVKFPK
jgi:hypothetical protein